MALRVGIITTAEEGYHKYLCAQIAERFEVVGVLHPRPPARPRAFIDVAAHARAVRKHGLARHVLAKLGSNKLMQIGWDLSRDVARSEAEFFPNAAADYDASVADRARFVDEINGPEGAALLKALKADVVVCSGGPIYREVLLQSAPLFLNFHTGVSPIYNGSESVFWTFANGQPHITGGTLMVMNARVDAGDMLAHFLPSVEAGDTPGRQFMKTIKGGANLYIRFLDHLAAGKTYVGAPQGRPFHYTVSADWSAAQNLAIERRIKQDVCAKFARPEVVSIYWDRRDAAEAKRAAEAFLIRLVYDA